jgi:hypothetical protein
VSDLPDVRCPDSGIDHNRARNWLPFPDVQHLPRESLANNLHYPPCASGWHESCSTSRKTRLIASLLRKSSSCWRLTIWNPKKAIYWRISMANALIAGIMGVLEFVFGCQHHLSRVFTVRGETYRVCCHCGAKYAYSLQTMSTKRRLPATPPLTRFRTASDTNAMAPCPAISVPAYEALQNLTR